MAPKYRVMDIYVIGVYRWIFIRPYGISVKCLTLFFLSNIIRVHTENFNIFIFLELKKKQWFLPLNVYFVTVFLIDKP